MTELRYNFIMRLAFYSDTNEELCKSFDKKVALLIDKQNPKITYIPSSSDNTRKYFNSMKEYFSRFGYTDFEYFDVDTEFDQTNISQLLLSDVIFLSGGNTFYFLNNLKTKGIDKVLIEFASKDEKTLIGVSAGSMIMTSTIANTAFYHKIKGDYEELNRVGLRDFTGLSLVNFEFIPHFSEEKKKSAELYSLETINTVYACPDGSGVIVNGSETFLYGDVRKLK